MLSKRFGTTTTSLGPLLGELGSLSSSGNTPNPYEKWSNGTDKMFLNGSGNGDSQNQVKKRPGWEFTKPLTQILNIFRNFRP